MFHFLIETRKGIACASLWVNCREILIFLTIFTRKGYITFRKQKTILHIRIIFGTKFQFKLKIFDFLDHNWPKRILPIINRNVNTTMEFCIFCILYVKLTGFDFLNQICPIRFISSWKWKKWTSPLNSAYSNY